MAKPVDNLQPLTWTPFQWMQWLVKFSKYGTLTPRDRRALLNQNQVRWFAWTTSLAPGGDPKLAAEQLRALAIETETALRRCASRQRWLVPYQVDPKVAPVTLSAEPGMPLKHVSVGFTNAFLTRVAELISVAGRSVRACARQGCVELFAVRRNGRFCSQSCASYVRTTNYRVHKREDAAREREDAFKRLLRRMPPDKVALLIESKRKKEANKEAKRLAQQDQKAGMDLGEPLDPALAAQRQNDGDLTNMPPLPLLASKHPKKQRVLSELGHSGRGI
jgi:hypothetical protein